MDALLLMVPLARANCHTGFGDFHMDPSGRVSRRRAGRVAPFVFTGVELVSKRLFDNPPEGAFSMNLLWDRATETGRCYGISHPGLWFDEIGRAHVRTPFTNAHHVCRIMHQT